MEKLYIVYYGPSHCFYTKPMPLPEVEEFIEELEERGTFEYHKEELQ